MAFTVLHHDENGYSPNVIRAKAGEDLTLTFIRDDPTPCFEEVVFEDFGIRKQLPLDKPVEITIRPKEARTYGFACGMNM